MEPPKDIGYSPVREEVFSKYFSEGNIMPSREDAIPNSVNLCLSENLDFNVLDRPIECFVVDHTDKGKTYVVKQTKSNKWGIGESEIVYFVDQNSNGDVAGYSKVRLLKSEDLSYKDKPYVANIFTRESHRRQGLGKRRYLLMNAVTQMLFGLPLHSDKSLTSDAKRRWEDLITEGKAVSYLDKSGRRYMFTS
jgi:GNAT superfamily N-acetyltransferase